MRISDWSSDVCSSDLPRKRLQSIGRALPSHEPSAGRTSRPDVIAGRVEGDRIRDHQRDRCVVRPTATRQGASRGSRVTQKPMMRIGEIRSEEHTSELQSLMRISYAVFCLKKKKQAIK